MKGREEELFPFPWIPAWAGGRTAPCLSRYIPAVGESEVRGQGIKVPVCGWGVNRSELSEDAPSSPLN